MSRHVDPVFKSSNVHLSASIWRQNDPAVAAAKEMSTTFQLHDDMVPSLRNGNGLVMENKQTSFAGLRRPTRSRNSQIVYRVGRMVAGELL